MSCCPRERCESFVGWREFQSRHTVIEIANISECAQEDRDARSASGSEDSASAEGADEVEVDNNTNHKNHAAADKGDSVFNAKVGCDG